jgi:nucleoside-diphosphate-sugar epimerase
LIEVARAKGVSGYFGDGQNRWPAAHVLDVARLYKLAIEQCKPGTRYHAVAEQGIPARDIAEVLGKGMGLPVKSIPASEAADHFGWLAGFVGLDMPASSDWTQKALGWRPTGPTLLEDLSRMDYSGQH